MKDVFAHITHSDNLSEKQRTQSLEAHNHNVSEIAKTFALDMGMGDVARVMGLLHDKGTTLKELGLTT